MSCFILEAESIRQITKFISTVLNSEDAAMRMYHMYGAPDSVKNVFKPCFYDRKYDGHKIYRMLYIANLRAYNGRYKDHIFEFEKYAESTLHCSKIQLYKTIQCYLYQCSEDPVYKTDFYNAMVDLKNTLAGSIINDMNEYQEAEWG